MTPEQASKIITEAMGGCWHEFDYTLVGPETALGILYRCKKCRTFMVENRPDYTTPEGFFKVWNWAKKQEWWSEFIGCYHGSDDVDLGLLVEVGLIDPQTFAITLANFLKEREK